MIMVAVHIEWVLQPVATVRLNEQRRFEIDATIQERYGNGFEERKIALTTL